MESPERIWTIGHSTLPDTEFAALLGLRRIEMLADVRRFPSSRLRRNCALTCEAGHPVNPR